MRTRTLNSIRLDILNSRKTIDAIVVSEWKDRPYTHDCHKSEFCDKHHQHVVTGDLNIIKHDSLRNLLVKGPTYREQQKIDWKTIRTQIKTGLTQCKRDWAKLENTNPVLLDDWIGTVMTKVDAKITSLTTRPTKHVKKIH